MGVFEKHFSASISKYDPKQHVPVHQFTVSIFDELESAGFIMTLEDPAAGDFYWADLKKVSAFMSAQLAESAIFTRRRKLRDDKFYRRAFETLLNQSFDLDEWIATTNRAASKSAIEELVKLDGEDPKHSAIVEGLKVIEEEFRASNAAGKTPAERDQILKGLSAAQELWSSTQLKVIQVKVGVVMAVEDALSALALVGKESAKSMLVDLIKSFVFEKVGIKL